MLHIRCSEYGSSGLLLRLRRFLTDVSGRHTSRIFKGQDANDERWRSSLLMMGLYVPETSVANLHTLGNNPEEIRPLTTSRQKPEVFHCRAFFAK